MCRRYGAVERNVSAVDRSPLSYESSARNAVTVQTKRSVTEKLRTAGVLCFNTNLAEDHRTRKLTLFGLFTNTD